MKKTIRVFSQFSEITDEMNESILQNEEPGDLNDIEITDEEIIKAIDDLEEYSAAGPDGVPAILLKKVKEALALPLSIMLRKSIDEGKIPDLLKLAYVTPIHKGQHGFVPGRSTQTRLFTLSSTVIFVQCFVYNKSFLFAMTIRPVSALC